MMMNNVVKTALRALISTIVLLGSFATLASEDHDRARQLATMGDILPLGEIIEKARAIHPGHVLEVELEEYEDGIFYEVEMLDEHGEVWEIYFDARTGKQFKIVRDHD